MRKRKLINSLVTVGVTTTFLIALAPLVSIIWTAISAGMARFDATFFNSSMRNVVGEGGGALHAIIGTLEVTALATVMSVPVGILTAIYLVEYGKGRLARAVTFFVDVRPLRSTLWPCRSNGIRRFGCLERSYDSGSGALW
jgi:phosphate transport system permease protein